MGEMASLWGYGENHDMEQLGQKLLCTTLELEKLKSEAMEEMKKNKDYINQLISLLKSAIQERDEARDQFQKLLNKTTTFIPESFPIFQPDSPLPKPGKANSSITESNSLSDPYNYHSHGSSPVESLFDVVSSPDFNLVQESNTVMLNNHFSPSDQESLIIDGIASGRVLPPKGKLLQAVLQAGPLLQSLMVAGPLPRWRNPPQLQPFQIPPVSIKSSATTFSYKPLSKFGQLSPLNCGTNASVMNTSGYSPLVKRQRFG